MVGCAGSPRCGGQRGVLRADQRGLRSRIRSVRRGKNFGERDERGLPRHGVEHARPRRDRGEDLARDGLRAWRGCAAGAPGIPARVMNAVSTAPGST